MTPGYPRSHQPRKGVRVVRPGRRSIACARVYRLGAISSLAAARKVAVLGRWFALPILPVVAMELAQPLVIAS
jgi:hypothetical protein